MEFSSLLGTDEIISIISSITSETIDGGTSDLTITSPSIIDGNATDSRVTLWIEDGTAGLKYRIEILVNTSGGQILQGDGLLKVTDR